MLTKMPAKRVHILQKKRHFLPRIVLTDKVLEAIHYADRAHKGQKRKGADISYITHPLGVALILAGVGANEDTIKAAILHDLAEDTGTTIADIEKKFGSRTARLVNRLTEKDKTLPWDVRKKIALSHIPFMSEDALLVKSADAIYNISEMILSLKVSGRQIFKKFNAPERKQRARYKKLLLSLKHAWQGNPLLPLLTGKVKQLEKACKRTKRH